MGNTFLIIDVSNLAYRCAYVNKELKTSKGRFSGHVFGSVASLLALLRNEFSGQNVTMVFCYDGRKAKDYRRTLLPEYKAHRMPHDIDPLPEVTEVLRLWPGLHIMQEDKEGDDAMVYAVKMRQGKPCVILSGDKDIWQLTQYPNCRVLSPNLKRFVETADIYEAYHLNNAPERIPLAKALFGDPSDGIKGVERLIKKQVEPILNAPGVLTPADFYHQLGTERPNFISEKMRAKLQDAVAKVSVNYEVVLPQLDFKKESTTKVGPESLFLLKQKVFSEYECFSLMDKF